MPAGCVPWKYSLFHASAHTPSLNCVPFHAPLVPLFYSLPFRSLIELAMLEARISRKPLQGRCSHCFFVNCLQKWRLFPAFTGTSVLKPDFHSEHYVIPLYGLQSTRRRQGLCVHLLQPLFLITFYSQVAQQKNLVWYALRGQGCWLSILAGCMSFYMLKNPCSYSSICDLSTYIIEGRTSATQITGWL